MAHTTTMATMQAATSASDAIVKEIQSSRSDRSREGVGRGVMVGLLSAARVPEHDPCGLGLVRPPTDPTAARTSNGAHRNRGGVHGLEADGCAELRGHPPAPLGSRPLPLRPRQRGGGGPGTDPRPRPSRQRRPLTDSDRPTERPCPHGPARTTPDHVCVPPTSTSTKAMIATTTATHAAHASTRRKRAA